MIHHHPSSLSLRRTWFYLLLLVACTLSAQDLPRFKRIVKQLSSSKYQGRGYALNGVRKAGRFIVKEFQKSGADVVMYQPFTLDINTFPGKMELAIDGRRLKAGRDFTVREYNPGIQGEFQLYHIDTLHYDFGRIKADLAQPENRGCFLVCDFWFPYRHRQDFMFLQNPDSSHIGGIIYTWNEPLKFYKAYGERVAAIPTLWTLSTVMPKDAKRIRVNVENHFYKDYATDNVVAKIVGRRHDSCFVFTAHYDHLGNLGRRQRLGHGSHHHPCTPLCTTSSGVRHLLHSFLWRGCLPARLTLVCRPPHRAPLTNQIPL